ncbi:peptidylprolyl isomerase [Fulvivirga sp.]|uniref:peptidylprolyl isomerase n=1 Tax=Fulvivirga sp. TaxID=1931237 RepID=UPI0032EEF213
MYKLLKSWPVALIIIIISACQSQVEKVESPVSNKFENEELVKIYDLIDKRDSKQLLPYLRHENDTLRYEATLGFGSIQDTSAIKNVAFNLNDGSPKVRKAAAYALGQMKDTAAIAPIVSSLEVEDSVYVRQQLLESLGKVITQEKLRQLQYWPLKTSDDKQGLAWGLYRAGLRNVHDGISVDLAISLLDSSNSYMTRLGAAHFLGRSRNLDLKGRSGLIIKSASKDKSPFVRMASALALGNAIEPKSLDALTAIAKDSDYRVRVNALRSLTKFEFKDIKTAVFESLDDENVNVGITAAGIVANKANENDLEAVTSLTKQGLPGRINAALLGTQLKLAEDKQPVIEAIISEYNNAASDYYKADLLGALGNSPLAHEFVVTKTFAETPKAIGTAGITALATMRVNENFPQKLEAPFADIFKQAIETKDIAMIAVAGSVITDPDLNFKAVYDSAKFLTEVRSTLQLPKDIEAIQMLDRAIAFFNNEEYTAPENEYNHPIDWPAIKGIDKEQIVKISTDKGVVKLRMLVNDAPGSVVNFIALAKSGYYNGKNFHRVVPNFVIQGGCNRGDGYGGEDYSIRSEFANLRYEEGSVGMASAGQDTEGTQWFITHSPTPHLDGSYTIFAKVTEGMDVVHKMEVGDKINTIELE